jgi:hypothetical protein
MAETAACRRVAILKHFGENSSLTCCPPPQLCDFCADAEGVRRQLDMMKGGAGVPTRKASVPLGQWCSAAELAGATM